MDPSHGKYLAVDYGDKRTGLAECDICGTIAGGIGTIRENGMKNTARRVVEEAVKRGCVRIIVGLPKNMDGSQGGRAKTILAFVALLQSMTEILVDTYDERMSTMVAYRYLDSTETYGKGRRAAVDTLSAQIILQDYLDKEKNTNSGT